MHELHTHIEMWLEEIVTVRCLYYVSKSYILDSKLHLIMLSQLVLLYKTIDVCICINAGISLQMLSKWLPFIKHVTTNCYIIFTSDIQDHANCVSVHSTYSVNDFIEVEEKPRVSLGTFDETKPIPQSCYHSLGRGGGGGERRYNTGCMQ